MRTSIRGWLLLLVLASALVAVTSKQRRGDAGPALEVTYVPAGRALSALAPGARLSIANYYWLLTVQYLGDQSLRSGDFAQLFPLVDLVTDLDPEHGYAYQTAGIALSSAGRLDESDRILKKGIDRGPKWWTYPFYLAFNSFFYRHDYETAARWADLAARTPGASTNISHLALSLKSKAGRPEDAIALLDELRGKALDEATERALDEQYKLAVLQRDFAALDAAVERFRESRGRPPSRLEEVVAAGLLTAIPPDPFGGQYYVDQDGRVHASERDFRFAPAGVSQWAPPPLYQPRTPGP
jgi:tetratricopeptide (TPR) repeat protein